MARVKQALCLLLLAAALPGCIRVKTEPIRVEPIQITMDVNLRVMKELDSFFGDLDAAADTMELDTEPPSSP
ncbi:MAG: hypothetical protein D6766_09060 [Verrucomicrobia bacterium]|nr:MAG: hypothetical protein D6766_09060 [Verrucomicrobiota bacterium]